LAATGLILAQLILGATMRHQHAGLAIPDFPLAYGKVWPAMDPQSVTHYNQQRTEVVAVNAITASQIALHMVHRLMALLILVAIVTFAWLARREFGLNDLVGRLSVIWFGLLLTQILLGAGTIWSSKAADIATAHVLVGALLLATGTILSIILLEHAVFARRPSLVTTRPSAEPAGSFGAQPSPVLGIE
jgi:cytochrome c oxidase assembly protein subunit 15